MEGTLSKESKPARRRAKMKPGELSAKIIFLICACLSIVAVFGIIGYILYGSIPAFREVGFFKFLFGTTWTPNYDKYGILPMLVNSIIVTVGLSSRFSMILYIIYSPCRLFTTSFMLFIMYTG